MGGESVSCVCVCCPAHSLARAVNKQDRREEDKNEREKQAQSLLEREQIQEGWQSCLE